ncbi:glycosyltransferase family 4 protein [Curtobacterium sp. 1310]|uniref:glycosyltransferase family 4 protein n=1 Tax=Curtobacterium sp. 1310 TaxID=2806570 RepID=UPI0027DC42D9|nr:glycosyltransferase family 4 protein [Curtobacterium sp. 1310]
MIRVIHLLPHIRRSGNGIVNAVVDLAIEQAALGNDVTICSAAGDYAPLLRSHGVNHLELPTEDWRNLRGFLALRRRLRHLRKSPTDAIVHSHTLGLLILAVTTGRKRLVHTLHNPWQRFAFLARLVPARFIVLSDRARRGVRARSASVVENGIVGSRRYQVEDVVPRELKRPALVTVCGLYERKGVQDLIAALELTRERWNLYVVGEGPYRRVLESQVRVASLERQVRFVGFDEDPLTWVAGADAFALASHSEGGALVLTEARMLRRPVIFTSVGDMPSMMRDEAGIAVPPGDAAALATNLDRLSSSEEELFRAAAKSQRGLEWYNVSRVARETLAVYTESQR